MVGSRSRALLGANLVIGAGALAYGVWLYGAPALALLRAGFSLPRLALFAGAIALGFVCNALRWRVLLAGVGAEAPILRLIALRAAAQSVSILIPSARLGGEPLRAYLLVQRGAASSAAIASVAVDRTLEAGASMGFACLFAGILLAEGVPQMHRALATVLIGAASLAVGLVLTVRRLRSGGGLLTAFVRVTGLDRLEAIRRQLGAVSLAEADTARLATDRARLAVAFAIGLVADVLVLVEYHLLLSAFGLPSHFVAVVAAAFATGATHSLPVPAGVGALEWGEMWLFGMLGYPADVGLAVGLAVRLRELVWILPGLIFLLAHVSLRGSARLTSSVPPL